MPISVPLSTPKTLADFIARLASGGVRTLVGERPSGVGEWKYSARYDEGPDVLYPKAHPVGAEWVRSAVVSGLVRPGTVDLLGTGRVMEFLIPATLTPRQRQRAAERAMQSAAPQDRETAQGALL